MQTPSGPRRLDPIIPFYFLLGLGDIICIFPSLARNSFNVSAATAALISVLCAACYGIFSFPGAILTGRWGMRAVLVLALAVLLGGELVPVLRPLNFPLLLLTTFILSPALVLMQLTGNLWLWAGSPPGTYPSRLSFHQFIKGLGSIAGPQLLGWAVALGWGWQGVFRFMAIFNVALLLLFMRCQAPPTPPQERASVRDSLRLLAEPRTLAYYFALAIYAGSEGGLLAWLADFLHRHFDLEAHGQATRVGPGLLFATLTAGRLLGSFMVRKVSPGRLLFHCCWVGLLCLAGLMMSNSLGIAVLSTLLCGLSFGPVWSLLFVLAMGKQEERATRLSGLLWSTAALGVLLPMGMGIVKDHLGARPAFLVPVAGFLYLLAISVYARQEERREAATPDGRSLP